MRPRSNAAPENIWIEGSDKYTQLRVPTLSFGQPSYVDQMCLGGSVNLTGLVSGDIIVVDYFFIMGAIAAPIFNMMLFASNPNLADGATVTTLPSDLLYLATYNSGITTINSRQLRHTLGTPRVMRVDGPLYFAAMRNQTGGAIAITSLEMRFGIIKRGA